MSAEMVTYKLRIKCEKEKYKEIKDILIQTFIKLELSPDEEFYEDDIEGWETLFEETENYLELYIDNCFGNYGKAEEYIEKEFIKQYSDILLEFILNIDYGGNLTTECITYDGKNVSFSKYDTSLNQDGYNLEITCPSCGGKLYIYSDPTTAYCSECEREFDVEELGLDAQQLYENLIEKPLEEFGNQSSFKLILDN